MPVRRGAIYKGKLDLDIPLAKGTEPKIVVDFQTDKARLQLAEPPLDLGQLKDFRFDSARAWWAEHHSASLRSADHRADLRGWQAGQYQHPRYRQSQVTVKRLTDWTSSQPLPVSGDIPYQLQLNLDGADSQLRVSSTSKAWPWTCRHRSAWRPVRAVTACSA